jgi:YidC/Oxa1 family membrane protein insertase
MEKRVVLAVLLMTAVILVTNLLFPPPPPEETAVEEPAATAPAAPAAPAFRAPAEAVAEAPAAVPVDTLVVSSPLFRYAISTQGAVVVRAELPQYPSSTRPGEVVQLVPADAHGFLAHRLAIGTDTIDLRTATFRASSGSVTLGAGDEPHTLQLHHDDPRGFAVEISYTFHPDNYLIQVRGRVDGLDGTPAVLLTDLGGGLEPHEDPAHRSEQQLAVVARPPDAGVQTVNFTRIAAQQPTRLAGPFAWAGIKDKYFLAALITPPDAQRFAEAHSVRLPDGVYVFPRGERADTAPLPRAQTTTVLPLAADGSFVFDAYLGPQEYGRLAALGQGLQEVNPYGYRWLRPVIRPIAAAILWVLDLLHNTLGVGYGWVLVIFGVLMRIVLWPLNAKAMRAQMKNMAVQPLMTEMREKHKDDPQRMQQEMIKLYKEHGFNPLAGCLPLLVPMPVLITLFFVFQDSIAFRGESFFWLPDLSLRDPLYILPVFLVVSMFALQWISAKTSGMEQNPQMKMMMYFMPLAIGFIFFMLPSGLNLYYATTNVATIPQQVLIGRERKKAQEAIKAEQDAKKGGAPAPPGGRPGSRPRAAKSRAKRRS